MKKPAKKSSVKEMKFLSEVIMECHQTAKDHGWFERGINVGEHIALMHSELSEALEDARNPERDILKLHYEADGKPCGFPSELADCVIRIFSDCREMGIDIEHAINEKMAYNKKRPYKHGGKRF